MFSGVLIKISLQRNGYFHCLLHSSQHSSLAVRQQALTLMQVVCRRIARTLDVCRKSSVTQLQQLQDLLQAELAKVGQESARNYRTL